MLYILDALRPLQPGIKIAVWVAVILKWVIVIGGGIGNAIEKRERRDGR